MEKSTWTNHAEWLSVFVTLVTGIFLFVGRMDRMEDRIEQQIAEQSTRTDALYEQFQFQVQCQNERTDKLYEMFIELVKERK